MSNNIDEAKLNDLINRLDEFMANGGGHMNVTSEGEINETKKPEVYVFNTNECQKNMACQIPTIHKGIDE